MVFKGLIAATASVALMATPAMSASSAPAAASATTEVAPASESAEGMQLTGGGNVVIIVLALIAAGLGLWALLDNDDSPASP